MFIFISCAASAGIGDELQSFYSNLGGSSNITPGGTYNGQSGGAFTGGSAYIRTPVKNLKLLTVQMPSISSGCHGIDVFTGGMGLVKSDQIVETLKSIGANAQGYMFSLMLSQISPQIEGQLKEWMAMVNDHNMNNINSCQAAMQAVDSGVNMYHSAMKQSCISNKVKENGGNRTEAMESCQDQEVVAASTKKSSEDGKEDEDALNINLTWYAINKSPILADLDDQTKYLLMTLIGTLIIDSSASNGLEVTLKAAKLNSNNLGILGDQHKSNAVGQSVSNYQTGVDGFKLYVCTDNHDKANGCLKVKEEIVDISQGKSFVGQVKQQLDEIEAGIKADSEPTAAETAKLKTFLDTTAIPIYHILNVYANTSYGGGHSPISASEYSELIGMDILYKFISQGILDVTRATPGLNLPKKNKEELDKMLSTAVNTLHAIQTEHRQKIKETNEVVLRVQLLEKQIKANSSSYMMGNLNFNRDSL